MKIVATIFIFCIAQQVYAQSRVVENIIPSADDDLNYEDLYENISQLTSNPLDLNSTTVEALLSLGILTPTQAGDIVEHRKIRGDFLEIYELQSILSLDLPTINELRPFITVRSSVPGKKFLERIQSQHNTYFFTRYERTLELAKGYRSSTDTSSRYRGDPGRIYSRFRSTSPGDMSIGLTTEKDAGEQFTWNKKQKGFDFYSAHLQLINKGPIINLIVGDYTAQFGQGLTLGGGFGIGKGSETITTLRRSSTGFMPYSSANEAGFFRGGATSLALPASIVMHIFGSSLSRDASSGDEGSLAVLQSGKHRTATEQSNRHRMQEKNFGTVIEYKGQSLETGIILHRTEFSQPINKSPTIYNAYDFRGPSNNNAGIFANYNLQNISFFSEVSRTIGHGGGWVGGALASITRNIDISLLVRRYDRDYLTFYSNAISENTAPKNESGVYWGWKHAITRKLSYTAYVDLFTFPWMKFRSFQPSAGSETLTRITYRHSKTIDFFIQFREERKARNISPEDSHSPAYQVLPSRRQNWVAGASMTFGDLSVRSRLQLSSFRQPVGSGAVPATRGFAIAFDAAYDWNKVSLATRFAIFDTDDFDNRQYMNERDVLMAFSFPAYYGEGTRAYVVGRFQPVRWLDLWVKLAETRYFNSTSSGSGGDTIEGNRRRDVKIEAVFRLS